MPPFRDWLERVLSDGESVQDVPPALAPAERLAVEELLRAAFERHALDVAGPPIPFDAGTAVRAAELLARACWMLVADDEGEDTRLDSDARPSSPSAHLSADVVLRFLPSVYRRSRARHPAEGLTAELDRLLRAWPLSGALADLDGEPAATPDFGGHPGLQLLYAERLVGSVRAGWLPPAGPAREWVERVYEERGKPLPAAPLKEEARD